MRSEFIKNGGLVKGENMTVIRPGKDSKPTISEDKNGTLRVNKKKQDPIQNFVKKGGKTIKKFVGK